MKIILLAIYILISPFILFSQNKKVGEPSRNVEYAVSLTAPLFYNYRNNRESQVLFLSSECIFSKHNSMKTSINLTVGKRMDRLYEIFEYAVGFEASKLYKVWKTKPLFIEFGAGIVYDYSVILTAKIGGRYELGKHLVFKVAYNPHLVTGFFNGTKLFYGIGNFVNVGIGYRIDPKTNVCYRTISRSLKNMQLTVQPSFRNSLWETKRLVGVLIESRLFTFQNFEVSFVGGVSGTDYGFHLFIPLGLQFQYEFRSHSVITGMNYIHNIFNSSFILQPELGYRYLFGKRILASISYAPYWWIYTEDFFQDNKRPFVRENVKFGLGYRFH